MATKGLVTKVKSHSSATGVKVGSESKYSGELWRTQRTTSTSHPWRRGRRYSWDVGGAFQTFSNMMSGEPAKVDASNGNWYLRGDIVPNSSCWNYKSSTFLTPTSWLDLVPYGSRAIAKCSPDNPHANVATMIGEAREGLPSVPGQALARARSLQHLPRSVANDHLNLEFGIKPLLSDLRALFKALRDCDHILEEYCRHAGKSLRRRYVYPTESSTSVTTATNQYGYPVGAAWLYSQKGRVTTTTTVSTDRWFSGAFCYYVPGVSSLQADLRRRAQLVNHVLGVLPSPELLWELLPYSWGVDWVVNIGDVMHNVSLAINDGLVMRYGYLMEHKREVVEYRMTGLVLRPNQIGDSCYTRTRYVKTRARSTPFGFGLTPGSFTDRQWALIAALGISRAPRSLDS